MCLRGNTQAAQSDPYCEVKVPPTHRFNTFAATPTCAENRFALLCLWLCMIEEQKGKGERRESHMWFLASSLHHVALLSQCLSAPSLSSPLSGSIRSTSSSWPHCVVAVSLFNLSFSLPLQLALSSYRSLTPFLVYTQSVGLFVIPLIPHPILIQVKKLLFLASFFFFLF